MTCEIREFKPEDAAAIGAVAVAAFAEYRFVYSDWPTFSRGISDMSALAQSGEIIVASSAAGPIGAVAYIGPGKPKSSFFRIEWPIIRMLVVHPDSRGQGIGRRLTEECISRAVRDGSSAIALHTSPIMKVALPMYQRMGFQWLCEAPTVFGVPYAVYLKQLSNRLEVS